MSEEKQAVSKEDEICILKPIRALSIDVLLKDLAKSANIKGIDAVEVDSSLSDVKSIVESAGSSFANARKTLADYVRDVPGHSSERDKPKYAIKPSMLSLFQDSLDKKIEVCLDVSEQKKGFFRRKILRSAKLVVNFRGDIQSFDYDIPGNDDYLPNEKLDELMRKMEFIVLANACTSEQETTVVAAVANIMGVSYFANEYFSRKYSKLCAEFNQGAQALLASGSKAVAEFVKRFSESLSEIEKQLSVGSIDAMINAHKANAKVEISAEIEKIKAKLEKYESAKRSEIEDYYAGKVKEINSLKAQCDERLKELEARYERRRIKLAQESQDILAGLEQIFPDCEVDGARNYEYTVDHDLRMFYAKRVEKDLSASENFGVSHALRLLKILRDACFPLNQKPRGAYLRNAYAGLLAVVDYVEAHQVSGEDVVKRINSASHNWLKRAKPSVEELLETALSYDFDMKKYGRSLHKNKAAKEDLGIA